MRRDVRSHFDELTTSSWNDLCTILKSIQSHQCFHVVVFVSLLLATDGLTVNFGSFNFTKNSPAWLGPSNWTVSGRLVVSDPMVVCNPLSGNNSIWEGAIVATGHIQCSFEDVQRIVQATGGLAVIQGETNMAIGVAGSQWNTLDGSDRFNIRIHLVFLSNEDFMELMTLINESQTPNNAGNLTTPCAYLFGSDPNEWYNEFVGASTAIVTSMFLIYDSVLLGFALLKLFTIIKERGFEIAVSTVTLFLTAIIAMGVIVIDIVVLVQTRVPPFYITIWVTIWLFIPDTLQIMASLTISFYWFELANTISAEPIIWLKKLKIPYIIIASFVGFIFAVVVVLAFVNITYAQYALVALLSVELLTGWVYISLLVATSLT